MSQGRVLICTYLYEFQHIVNWIISRHRTTALLLARLRRRVKRRSLHHVNRHVIPAHVKYFRSSNHPNNCLLFLLHYFQLYLSILKGDNALQITSMSSLEVDLLHALEYLVQQVKAPSGAP